jgi:hypothetical protein
MGRRGAGSLVLAIGLVSCGPILGVQDIHVDADDGGIVGDVDASGGPEGAPPGSSAACAVPGDCPAIATTPADCAEVQCVGGVCQYRAKDRDQDGHRAARCDAPGVAIERGDDCADDDDALYPGHPRPCGATSDGTPIVFPNGVAVGACKLGEQSCAAGDAVGPCLGAVGPSPEQCTGTIDEDCDGNAFNGCACSPGDTKPCGSSATGVCKLGTTTCSNNMYGACVGNVEPKARDCTSGLDNDCNGTPDNAEVACQCPGGNPPGGSRACNTHPQDGVGICHAGSQTCIASGSTSSWGGCSGDQGPLGEQCDGNDYDCNGVAGVNDPAPAPPAGTLNCTHVFRCPAAGRGALYYRTGIGFTNYAGSNTLWTAYAPQGDFSAGTYPPGEYRIAHDATGTKLGPVSVGTACCASGCATSYVYFDGNGQFYTPAP